MILDRLFNQGPMPVLEQELTFTDARQQLLAQDAANISTPGYRQKDLSVEKFQSMLRDKVDQQEASGNGSVSLDDVESEVENPTSNILFHDGNNRSMEQMMTENAKNALMHNLIVELLRKQYATMDMALKERAS